MLNVFKNKQIKQACSFNVMCEETIKLCLERGLLNLKFKGYSIAYNLQNPYICMIPLSGVYLRVKNILN